jgi:hypothetical protein
MPVTTHLPGYKWFHVFKNVSVRMGVYVGVCLSLVMGAWIFVANRLPFLERFALERNLAAAAALGFLFLLPVLRFLRSPGNLLASGLIAWTIFSSTYRLLCMFFELLGDKYSAFHVFMLGLVVYMILATFAWIGTMIWRARASGISHPKNHVS